jgi:hypothetical protein
MDELKFVEVLHLLKIGIPVGYIAKKFINMEPCAESHVSNTK